MPRGNIDSILALAGVIANPGRRTGEKETIDEIIHPWALAIVDTPTPPTGARRIDVDRWEDLLRAAELLGRPILRLHGGEGGSSGRLFYVADGPQSYVFGFTGGSLGVARSGAFAPYVPPVVIPTPPETVRSESAPAPPAESYPLERRVPAPRPAPPPEVPDPADALLGPEIFEEGTGPEQSPASRSIPTPPRRATPVLRPIPPPVVPVPAAAPPEPETFDEQTDAELPSATVVERRIREMIHELLADFRKLPPSSDRLELGTEHIQRAIDMLHLGRYGVAQIELNKAARLLREEPRS